MKFNLGDTVKVKKGNKFVIIEDYEFFDNLILYYTSDKNAYPEEGLEKNGLQHLFSLILKNKPHYFSEKEISDSMSSGLLPGD